MLDLNVLELLPGLVILGGTIENRYGACMLYLMEQLNFGDNWILLEFIPFEHLEYKDRF